MLFLSRHVVQEQRGAVQESRPSACKVLTMEPRCVQVAGSRYGDALFPHVKLADGQSAHLYRWGQSTHAP